MEPGEALSTASQLAMALAGFASVVVVFRSDALHEWAPIRRAPRHRNHPVRSAHSAAVTPNDLTMCSMAATSQTTFVWRRIGWFHAAHLASRSSERLAAPVPHFP